MTRPKPAKKRRLSIPLRLLPLLLSCAPAGCVATGSSPQSGGPFVENQVGTPPVPASAGDIAGLEWLRPKLLSGTVPQGRSPAAGGTAPGAALASQTRPVGGRASDLTVQRTATQTPTAEALPNAATGLTSTPVVAEGTVPANAGLRGGPPPPIPAPPREFSIDLTSALRLAEVENPQIAEARQRIREALAVQLGAQALLLPSLNAGTSYHGHTGDLQRSSGKVLSVSQQALYVGGGARTVAAESVSIPAVNIYSPLTDALFEPLAAKQLVAQSRYDAKATANSILLEVAELHFDLLAAEATLAYRRESSAQAAVIARRTRSYADAQQGRDADARRAATELGLIDRDVLRDEEDAAVAAARLSRRLHLDQSVRVRPVAPSTETVTVVDPGVPLPDLIEIALRNRPEIGATTAGVAAAENRLNEEKFRPLLPTLWVGFSGGGFGGGSNLSPPLVGNFHGRTDFDARLYWTVQNFGLGNLALIKNRRGGVGVALGDRAREVASVRSQVSAAYGRVISARDRIGLTTRQVASAEVGYREDVTRLENTVGRPLEAVNSLSLLNRARVDRVRAVTEYNKAEFALFVALGSPPPLGETADQPLAPAPIASPPLPPLEGVGDVSTPPPVPLPPGPSARALFAKPSGLRPVRINKNQSIKARLNPEWLGRSLRPLALAS